MPTALRAETPLVTATGGDAPNQADLLRDWRQFEQLPCAGTSITVEVPAAGAALDTTDPFGRTFIRDRWKESWFAPAIRQLRKATAQGSRLPRESPLLVNCCRPSSTGSSMRSLRGCRLVEGNEQSYTYSSPAQYATTLARQREFAPALFCPGNRARWQAQAETGIALSSMPTIRSSGALIFSCPAGRRRRRREIQPEVVGLLRKAAAGTPETGPGPRRPVLDLDLP